MTSLLRFYALKDFSSIKLSKIKHCKKRKRFDFSGMCKK